MEIHCAARCSVATWKKRSVTFSRWRFHSTGSASRAPACVAAARAAGPAAGGGGGRWAGRYRWHLADADAAAAQPTRPRCGTEKPVAARPRRQPHVHPCAARLRLPARHRAGHRRAQRTRLRRTHADSRQQRLADP
ncbi:hypothetical protein G6F58_013058 [Rhizopus delemar]|nr:hypothetical protein G6F58_013058 [Rhizopus delemar]